MNIKTIKKSVLILLAGIYFFSSSPVQASPWAEKEGGYWSKTGNKFVFGLKNSLFGWLSPWVEAKNPKYKKEWEGFSAGIGYAVVYTAGGLIHLVTFPIPVDFPHMKGLHIPQQNCPYAPYGVDKSAAAETPAVPAEPVVEAAPEPVTEVPAPPVTVKPTAPPAPVVVPPPAVEPVAPKTLKRTAKKSAPAEETQPEAPADSDTSVLIK